MPDQDKHNPYFQIYMRKGLVSHRPQLLKTLPHLKMLFKNNIKKEKEKKERARLVWLPYL